MALAASLPRACLDFRPTEFAPATCKNLLGSFSQLHEILPISGHGVREPPRFLAPRYPGVIELAAREVLGSEALEYLAGAGRHDCRGQE